VSDEQSLITEGPEWPKDNGHLFPQNSRRDDWPEQGNARDVTTGRGRQENVVGISPAQTFGGEGGIVPGGAPSCSLPIVRPTGHAVTRSRGKIRLAR